MCGEEALCYIYTVVHTFPIYGEGYVMELGSFTQGLTFLSEAFVMSAAEVPSLGANTITRCSPSEVLTIRGAHHHEVLTITRCSPSRGAHHHEVLTITRCSPSRGAHHHEVLTITRCSPSRGAHHHEVLTVMR